MVGHGGTTALATALLSRRPVLALDSTVLCASKMTRRRPPPRRLLVVLPIVLLGWLARAQGYNGGAWTPLRVYVHTPGAIEDYSRSCYPSSSSFVSLGSPEGCGVGCQHISSVNSVSSEYVYEGLATSVNLVGKPSEAELSSTSLLGQSLSYSWAPLQPNAGAEHFEFEVGQETVVAKLEVFQGHNPGAVTGVEAFDVDRAAWVEIWSAATDPAGSSKVDGRVLTVYAQVRAGRVVASRFKVTLDTSAVVGYNTIDGVRVHGLGRDGKALSDHSPLCSSGTKMSDCYYECKAEDEAGEAAVAANFNVVRASVGWLETALKVRSVDAPHSGSKTEVEDFEALDTSQMCQGLPIVEATKGMEDHHADVAVVVTHRPSFTGAIEARSCSRFTDTSSLQRPAVIHLNLVPGFARGATITGASELLAGQVGAQDSHLAVVDTVTHYLYRALGWDAYFRNDFMGYNRANVTTEKQQAGTTWAGRYRAFLNLPKMVQRAEDHFGASGIEGVELENSDAAGCRGVCLESRVYNGEVMASPPYARDMRFSDATHAWTFSGDARYLRPAAKSAISLAYFEETGWYQPSYLEADHLSWGGGAGNDFVKQGCKTWAAQGGEASRYLCKPEYEPALYTRTSLESAPYPTSQKKQCTFDRMYKGMCVTKLWGADLPGHSEFWPLQSGMGGISSQLDYCPVVAPDPSMAYNNAGFHLDCRDAAAGPADPTTRFFEEFGESSRCFETNTLGDSQVFTSCLAHKCTQDGTLHVKVQDETKACPMEGGKLTFTQSGVMVDCTGQAHLCAAYRGATKPTVSVLSPLDSAVVSTRDLEASLLIDNYALSEHYLKILVDDTPYETVTDFRTVGFARYSPTSKAQETPDRQMLTAVDLGSLPVRARSSTNSVRLRYELTRSVDGAEVALSSVETNHFVSNTLEQWASPVNASSENALFPLQEGLAAAEDSKGWLPQQVLDDGSDHYVVVELASEVQVGQISVYYNFGYANQQLKSVSVANTDDPSAPFTMVWKRNETERNAASSTDDVDTVTFDPAPFFSKLVKVEFEGAQWVEVDAIKCEGFLKIVPSFQGGALEVEVPSAATTQAPYPHPRNLFSFSVPFSSTHARDSATIFWRASLADSSLDWVHVGSGEGIARVLGPEGEQPATLSHNATLVIDATKAPKVDTTLEVRIRDRYETDPAAANLATVTVTISNKIDANDDLACYDGVLVAENLAKRCACAPGARGTFCELHDCPSGCSGNGVCDSFTGRCTCADGFYGLDCSGKHPKCYVSKDGTCEVGFGLGTYVIDSGSPNSVNFAEGNAPHSLLCDGSVEPKNEFECSALSKVEFCCQDKLLPSCPFVEGSAPCGVPGCPYISAVDFQHAGFTSMADVDASLGLNATARSECTAALRSHCYSSPEEPACAGLVRIETPASECPVSVPVEHCKASKNAGLGICSSLLPGLASFPKCNFVLTDDVLHPCRTKKCEEDPFSLGECRALIEQHCAKYPEDRECELHGLGDGCFFLPGSSPCLSVDCQQSGFLSDACQEVVRGYCTYGSTPDPECLVYGYGNSLLRDLVESFTCPWDSVEASCDASNVAFDFCAMIKGGKIARHASPASLKFDPSIQESLLELHAAAVKAHRNAQAPLGLVSTLLNRMGGDPPSGARVTFNDREIAALLSLLPLEAVLRQYFVHYDWSDETAAKLEPLLFSSGFSTEAEIQSAVEDHLFSGQDPTRTYLS